MNRKNTKYVLCFLCLVLLIPTTISDEIQGIKASKHQSNLTLNTIQTDGNLAMDQKSSRSSNYLPHSSIIASTPEDIANTLPDYMFNLFDNQTGLPIYAKELGLTYPTAMDFQPLRIENLEKGAMENVTLSIVPKIKLKMYLQVDTLSGNLDLYVYEGDTITGEPIASSLNPKDYDEILDIETYRPMNITIAIVHNAQNTTADFASGTLYVSQYNYIEDIYRLYIEGKHPSTHQPQRRTNIYIPHLKYYSSDVPNYGTDGIYLSVADTLLVDNIKIYDDFSRFGDFFFGTDNQVDYSSQGSEYGQDLRIWTEGLLFNDGFKMEINGREGSGFVTLGFSLYAYGQNTGFHKSIYPKYQTFNHTQPVIPFVAVNPTVDPLDFEPRGVYLANNDTKVTDVISLNGTTDAVIPGIHTYYFQPAEALEPGTYYMNIRVRNGGVYVGRFFYFKVVAGEDTSSPTIHHLFLDMQHPELDQTLLIYANVTDNSSPVETVTLHYRKGIDGDFTAVKMTNMFDGIYCAPISLGVENFQIGDTVQYYLTATDSWGNMLTEDNNGTYYSFIVSDFSGPTISDVTITPHTVIEEQEVQVTCRVADPSGVKYVELWYSTDKSSFSVETMSLTTDINYSATIGPFDKGKRVYLFIVAVDNSSANNPTYDTNKGQFYVFDVLDKDMNPPVIANIQHNPANPTDEDNITITCEVTDDTSVAYVTLYYRINRGSWYMCNMTANDTLYTCTIGPFSAGDQIDYYVVAYDSSLNHNEAIDDNEGQYYSFEIVAAKKSPIQIEYGVLSLGLLVLLLKKRKKV